MISYSLFCQSVQAAALFSFKSSFSPVLCSTSLFFSQKLSPPPLCGLSVSRTLAPPIAKPSHVCLQIKPAIYSKRSHQQTRWPLD